MSLICSEKSRPRATLMEDSPSVYALTSWERATGRAGLIVFQPFMFCLSLSLFLSLPFENERIHEKSERTGQGIRFEREKLPGKDMLGETGDGERADPSHHPSMGEVNFSVGCAGGYFDCRRFFTATILDFVTTKRCEVITTGALDVLSLSFSVFTNHEAQPGLATLGESWKSTKRPQTSHRRSSPVTCSLSTHFIHDSVIIACPSLSFLLLCSSFSFPIHYYINKRVSFSSSRSFPGGLSAFLLASLLIVL